MEGGEGDVYKIKEQVEHDEGQLGGTFKNCVWGGGMELYLYGQVLS